MAKADQKATTPRFLTLPEAAVRIGREELEVALIEGRLLAWQREDWARFEELDRFCHGFALRGVSRDDLDAVRAISRGFAIPTQSWRRWFADGSVNFATGEIARLFEGYHRVVIFRPVLQSADIPTQSRRRPPKAAAKPTVDSPSRKPSSATADSPRVVAIKKRLNNNERPGNTGTVGWKKFCDDIRTDCDAVVGDPKNRKFRRGFSDDRIEDVTRGLMKSSSRQT